MFGKNLYYDKEAIDEYRTIITSKKNITDDEKTNEEYARRIWPLIY